MQRKLQVATCGRSIVATTCQIPALREQYRSIGLSDRSGYFVEIGGFDGESFSNTSFLADQGWRGVYVEPVPRHVRLIKMRHVLNRVTVEAVAVAKETGHVELAVMGSLTTADPSTEAAYDDIDWAKDLAKTKTRVIVKADTLEDILARNEVPENFDLLVLDIEGGEEEIVDALLASKWRPTCVVIELVDFHADFVANKVVSASNRSTRQKIKSAGYEELFVDHINTIFVLNQSQASLHTQKRRTKV